MSDAYSRGALRNAYGEAGGGGFGEPHPNQPGLSASALPAARADDGYGGLQPFGGGSGAAPGVRLGAEMGSSHAAGHGANLGMGSSAGYRADHGGSHAPIGGGNGAGNSGGSAAWRRWKMSAFDAPPPPPPAAREAEPLEPAPPPIDFQALEAMREGARKEGYAQGYTQGQTQGYGDGHREGYARGLETARQEAARLQQIASAFTDALRKVDDEVGQTLIALALDVARKLVHDTVVRQPTVLLPAVRELLTTEPALSGTPCLLLHPDDVELVQTHLAGELEAAGWAVRTDASIERGGCVATAASGELDGTLATRWSRVIQALGRNDPWEAKDV